MKIKFILSFIFIFSVTANANILETYENKLMPFTSDGCSRFPDGIPYFNAEAWRNCCVQHDVYYWQGGTAQQRVHADNFLKKCVASTGHPAIAEAMYLGVRMGGNTKLPFSWRWGYGWVIPRGYNALTPDDQEQVNQLSTEIPTDLNQVKLGHATMMQFRPSLTGNYCSDAVIAQVELRVQHSFNIIDENEIDSVFGDQILRTVMVVTDACEGPFEVTFIMKQKDACNLRAITSSGQLPVKVFDVKMPRDCH